MTLLLDSRTLPTRERAAAMEAALSTNEVPCVFGFSASEDEIGHRVDYWDWGVGTHVTRILGSGLRITRGSRQVRAGAPERLGLGLPLGAPHSFEHRELRQIVEPGELALTDSTSAHEATWPSSAGAAMLLIDYDQLGVNIDVVRRSIPRLASSPLYSVTRSH